MSEIGEAGVGDVKLGTNRNLQEIGARNSLGTIDYDGKLANGVHDHGRAFAINKDGYVQFNDNDIYLSKSTVRQMWRGKATAKETLFHEWFHARDYYSGYASFLHSQNPSNYQYILEYRAHSFNYSRLPTPERLYLMNYYKSLF